MNTLLKLAVEAHGGLERWKHLEKLDAEVSINGVFWELKGRPGILNDARIEAYLHRQEVSTQLGHGGNSFHFTPTQVTVGTADGVFLERRLDARSSFEGQVMETPWDDLHLAYFNSYALWTYLTIPFLYTYPGFVVEELSPWEENGEEWRTLKATFPNNFPSHSREQISYFGVDGLLRRHEYKVDALGGAQAVNYASDYRSFNGILVPTTREVFAYDAEKQKIPGPPLISIRIKNLTFS